MEKRKNPEKDLRSKSGLFFQIGLLITMMLCVSAFEYRTHDMIMEPIVLTGSEIDVILPPITIQDPPPPPPKPKIIKIVEVPNKEPLEEEPFIELVIPTDITIPEVIEEPPVEIVPEIHIVVEEMPLPVGGYESFFNFVRKNLKYPAQARRMGIEGKVLVQFVVDESGNLTNIEILRGIGAGCDEEVLRIMNEAPRWNPGKQRGVPVRVKTVMPIDFRLN
jgi:periplasmic protein TonB